MCAHEFLCMSACIVAKYFFKVFTPRVSRLRPANLRKSGSRRKAEVVRQWWGYGSCCDVCVDCCREDDINEGGCVVDIVVCSYDCVKVVNCRRGSGNKVGTS